MMRPWKGEVTDFAKGPHEFRNITSCILDAGTSRILDADRRA